MNRIVLLLALFPLSVQADEAPGNTPADRAARAKRLQGVTRFGYQLQLIDIPKIAESPADLAIVEPMREAKRITKEELALLKKKPDGSPRIVLAYLSIGEAEDYRTYWNKDWAKTPPPWLSQENPEWKGNYKVKYWDPGWQKLILGQPTSLYDRILADRYDGVYLDLIDAFEYWEQKGEKGTRAKMVEWVKTIAEHGRKANPKFLVVPQNGESLAKEKGYLDLVDGLGREDLFFHRLDQRQSGAETDAGIADIKLFQAAGKAVFLIEYVRRIEFRNQVVNRARQAGYVPLIAVRKLDFWTVSPVYSKN
jgi:cysteinyl-tRNA synthetase, unknown class